MNLASSTGKDIDISIFSSYNTRTIEPKQHYIRLVPPHEEKTTLSLSKLSSSSHVLKHLI